MRFMSYYGDFHDKFISPRRRRVIKDAVVEILPKKDHYESWLDVGTADQKLFRLIYESLDHCTDVQTLDIYPVANPALKHTVYDGKTIPFPDNSFDIVSFIDVLHHTDNITDLLAEAKRVAKKFILIKDHKYETGFHKRVLEIQDWFGRFSVKDFDFPLPYEFLTYNQWQNIFVDLQLKVICLKESMDYSHPFPFDIVYPAHLHFVCLLQK